MVFLGRGGENGTHFIADGAVDFGVTLFLAGRLNDTHGGMVTGGVYNVVLVMTVYLSAITPSCATVTSMAQLYNRDAAHSSALYVLSTLLSIMTMPLMIGLFDMLV